MIYLGPGGYQLGFDLFGTALLAVIVLCVFIAAVLVTLRVRRLVRPLLVAAALTCLVQIPRSVMAPPSAWQTMVAAVHAAQRDEKADMVREVRKHWRYGDMTAVSWYVVSRKWGVCHDLWPQFACRRPAAPYEAFGIAREILDDITAGQGEWAAFQ